MDNPEFKKMQFNVGTLRTIVYQLSGKQINETELAWLNNEILPNLKQPNKNFAANLEQLSQWLGNKLGNQIDSLNTSYVVPANIAAYGKSQNTGGPLKPSLDLGKGKGKLSPEDEAAAYLRGR